LIFKTGELNPRFSSLPDESAVKPHKKRRTTKKKGEKTTRRRVEAKPKTGGARLETPHVAIDNNRWGPEEQGQVKKGR